MTTPKPGPARKGTPTAKAPQERQDLTASSPEVMQQRLSALELLTAQLTNLHYAQPQSPFTIERMSNGGLNIKGATPREGHFIGLLLGVLQERGLDAKTLQSVRDEAAAEARLTAEATLVQAEPSLRDDAAAAASQVAQTYVATVKTRTVREVVRDQHGDIVRVEESTVLP